MQWVRDIDSLYDFIGYVVLRAPDRFPKEDFLRLEEQMTLDRAFDQLRHGVILVQRASEDVTLGAQLNAILDEALALYKEGEEVKAAHRVQDFQDLIYKG